ncbi:hypothetical protein [Eisenibacter elegans]|uniref:hypothetical protein n=1 Tax=Eisenibacter elegans TaxID=997 RepID=UPI00041DE222|nr:hypothetical protein [Eisenibacter elegans]
MVNDPELDGKYLGTITQDFVKVSQTLQEASYQLRVRKISDYPIFPISKVGLPVGQLLLDKNTHQLTWNYYFSFLDEFVQRQLVADEQRFKDAYKNPEEFCCLFVVDEQFTNFVFVPYPEEDLNSPE